MNQELPRYLKKRIVRLLLSPLKLLPVKQNKVFIHNDLAYNYSANPKYIAEGLLKRFPGKFEIVFSVKEPEKYKNSELPIKFVKFNSWNYFWHAMLSKVFVSNSGGYSYLPLRKNQFVINTHHGGGCYKTCGLDMFEDTPLFRKDLKLSSDQTDVFLSTNRRFSEVVSKASLLPIEKMWEIGMPRNDALLRGDKALRDKVRKKLGLSNNDRLVIYAPTYRKTEDDYFKESVAITYGIDCERVCNALHERFSGNWVFGFRLHPCVTNRDNIPKGNVIDLSGYEEMQELLLAADVMINDFSSSMWDFMLTGKPCFIYAFDLENYVKTTNVYTPVSKWPFPKATTNEELVENILHFNEEKYREDCKKHYEMLGGCETGKATELVCELIYIKCYGGSK